MRNRDEMAAELFQARIFLRQFVECMVAFGTWKDGCFHYREICAPELQCIMEEIREKGVI